MSATLEIFKLLVVYVLYVECVFLPDLYHVMYLAVYCTVYCVPLLFFIVVGKWLRIYWGPKQGRDSIAER